MEETKTTPAVRTKLHKALETIASQLKEVKAVTEAQTQTNGDFKWSPNYQTAFNIHREKNLSNLITAHQYIRTKYEEYNKSAKELGLSEWPEFTWCGYTWPQWENDIKIKVAIASQHDRLSKLKSAEAQLRQFLTNEDRLEITLKELGLE